MNRFHAGVRVQVQPDGSGTLLRLSGAIDESAHLVELVPRLRFPLTVDLGEIEFINSIGVREWVHFLRAVVPLGDVKLRKCSQAMVLQFNMVTDTVGGAHVDSFEAPYVCEACEVEESRLIDTAHMRPLPDFACHDCGGKLIFAETAERYLGFLEAP
jgi:hypothetical protein